MALTKFTKMARFIPGLYKPDTNTNIRGVLLSWSKEDDRLIQAVKDAKEQLFVLTAQLQFLDVLGSNVGVFRPTAFNLADSLFRQLIPLLSFHPKQIVPTIKAVLNVFWGNDPRLLIKQINPNVLFIRIPETVPSLRRTLKGSHHFHHYSGSIVSVNNITKEIVINLELNPLGGSNSLVIDEVKDGLFGQDRFAFPILSNSAGTSGITLQFSAGFDLSVISTLKGFNMTNPRYPGSFMPNPNALFIVTKQRGAIGVTINPGNSFSLLTMTDASGIPDAPGELIFSYGKNNQEGPVKYFSRPNNSTLKIDPSFIFAKTHAMNELTNVIVKPYQKPSKLGNDYSIYLVGVEAARLLAQEIIRSLVAAGIVVEFDIVEPIIDC